MSRTLTSIEICAGAGGQALGLEQAGFDHLALVESDPHACETLRSVRRWKHAVRQTDVRDFRAVRYEGIDLLAGGVPCPPFSRAGQRLGADDERDLFPEALRLAEESQPRAIMLENVRNLLGSEFESYRNQILQELDRLGYVADWQLLEARNFGVPQLRPRAILVAFRRSLGIRIGELGAEDAAIEFTFPEGNPSETKTVGQTLHREMARNGWKGAREWAEQADGIAPTLVGGSKKHGGADLGPAQAKKQWRERLGVDGLALADDSPEPNFHGLPRLTLTMTALIQGFPPTWRFQGGKTAAYRQVGNAFPPPVARAVGERIAAALHAAEDLQLTRTAQKTNASKDAAVCA